MFSSLERFEALQGTSGPFERNLTLAQTVMREHLPQDEGKTGGQRINRQRLALEIGVGRNVGLNYQPQECGVAPHECEKIRRHIDFGFALSLLIGDDVVK